jgi:glycosyltransferase involved in cell wall biosynthesis
LTERLHILIISSWFPTKEKPFVGNFVEYQAICLSQIYNVTFLKLLPESEKELISDGMSHVVYYQTHANPILNRFSKRKALKDAIQKLEKVDIVHGHVSYPSGWMFRMAKKLLNVPLVLTEHASYFAPASHWNFRMNYEITKIIKSADVVIAVSDFLAADIQKRTARKPIVIGNPIDVSAFLISTDKPAEFNFLHISTLAAIKNIEPVLSAFKKVYENNTATRLKIVSDENYSHLKKWVEEQGLEKVVSFFGPVAYEQIPSFYQTSHCFVLNSVYETFSIVVTEAWSSGIPVISTSVGVANKIPKELGELTDGTATGIEKAMMLIMERYADFQPDAIRGHATQFSIQEFLKHTSGIYDSLLK